MDITADFTVSFALPDVNPYVNADFDFITGDARILDLGLRSSAQQQLMKAVYNGALSTTAQVVALATPSVNGVKWHDFWGPAIINDAGAGYWFRVQGNTAAVLKQAPGSTTPGTEILGTHSTIPNPVTTDVFSIMRSIDDGKIYVYRNDVIHDSFTDPDYDDLKPSTLFYHGASTNAGIGDFGVDGIAAEPGTPPSWLGDVVPPQASEGEPYTYDFTALIAGDPPITASSIGVTLPAGLSVVGKTITGTPTTAGTTQGHQLRATGFAPAADSNVFDMTVGAVTGVEPVISGVNSDNSVTSEEAGGIDGVNFTGTTSVRMGQTELSFSEVSDIRLTYLPLDFHGTTISPCSPETITVTTAEGAGVIQVEPKPKTGNTFVITTFIDTTPEHPGLLGTTTIPAVAGDCYEGELLIAGETVRYDPVGPHREHLAVPDGTPSISWHYSKAAKQWEQINEIINQGAASGVATLSDPDNETPVADTNIGVTFTTDVGGGVAYLVATLTNELPNPTPEEIKAGIGESSANITVTDPGAQGPVYLAELDPATRYYYWIVQESSLGVFSNIISGTALTTATPVGTPDEAILTDPFEGVAGGTFGSVGVTSSSSLGTLYFVAMLEPEEPSEDDIKFGIGAASHSSAIPKVGVNGPYLLDGLDPTQLYYYWFVQDTNTDRSGEE